LTKYTQKGRSLSGAMRRKKGAASVLRKILNDIKKGFSINREKKKGEKAKGIRPQNIHREGGRFRIKVFDHDSREYVRRIGPCPGREGKMEKSLRLQRKRVGKVIPPKNAGEIDIRAQQKGVKGKPARQPAGGVFRRQSRSFHLTAKTGGNRGGKKPEESLRGGEGGGGYRLVYPGPSEFNESLYFSLEKKSVRKATGRVGELVLKDKGH